MSVLLFLTQEGTEVQERNQVDHYYRTQCSCPRLSKLSESIDGAIKYLSSYIDPQISFDLESKKDDNPNSLMEDRW